MENISFVSNGEKAFSQKNPSGKTKFSQTKWNFKENDMSSICHEKLI